MKQAEGLSGETDVLIVGGGPAGLAASIVLARAGLRTLLCEKKTFPVDKACGEGIMPTGVAYLKQLGVSRYLRPEAFYPFIGVRYHSHTGQRAAAPFAEGPGWGMRRPVLSAALLQRARELDCLKIIENATIRAVARTVDHIAVQIAGQTVLTRLLVGADGLNSGVRRWAGLEKNQAHGFPRWPTPKRWGARQHFYVTPWSDYVEVHWSEEGIEAYITPCGAGQLNVAFLWDSARYHRLQGGKDFYASLLKAFPALQARLKQAEPADRPRAMGPLYRQASAPVTSGVVLIGDAAGYLDAVTGEGISLAMASALALGRTVAPLLINSDGAPNAAQLANYARAYQAIVRPYYQLTWLALLLSRHSRLARHVISALASQPDVFQHLLSANMGLASLWSPQYFARLLRGQ
jgi:flavin-dependent dehydrogenase